MRRVMCLFCKEDNHQYHVLPLPALHVSQEEQQPTVVRFVVPQLPPMSVLQQADKSKAAPSTSHKPMIRFM